MTERVILHCDLNNFYAGVELLDRPDLKHTPVAVCGRLQDRHGIVLAKNDVAKNIGVKTAVAIWQAKQICPDLTVIDADYTKYKYYSEYVRNILYHYTDIVEPFGPDESWLDVTGSVALFGDGVSMAHQIREEIKKKTGLTVSIGVSFNKIFAKLGSNYKKPDAVTFISKENFKQLLFPLPADAMFGVGKNTYAKLQRIGIQTIGDLADSDIRALKNAVGIIGERLWYCAMGLDMTPVVAQEDFPQVKSISRSTTAKHDLENSEDVWQTFLHLSESIAKQLAQEDFYALKLTVHVRENTLKCFSYSKAFTVPLRYSLDIARAAIALFNERYHWEQPLRSVGICVSELMPGSEPLQLSFYSAQSGNNHERIDHEMFKIREKFGKQSICKASLIGRQASMPEYKNFS